MAQRGLRKVVDFQDEAYGQEYLDRLERAVERDKAARRFALSIAAAKHLANAMCYDDMIRVADPEDPLDARRACAAQRSALKGDAILQTSRNISTRARRGILRRDAGRARPLHRDPAEARRLHRPPHQSRPPHPHLDSFSGFAMLWLVGGTARWRRTLLRHQVEQAHLDRWYRAGTRHCGRNDYALAVEILECPSADQGLQRHPRPRAVEIRPRALSALPI